MKNINLNEIYDDKSSELYNIAKLMFGNRFHLVFDKYVFTWSNDQAKKDGKLYSIDGEQINPENSINSVAPLINQDTNETVAYLIITEKDVEFINNSSKKSTPYVEDLFNLEDLIVDKDNDTIDIIDKSGEIIKYRIIKLGESRDEALKRIYRQGLFYKNRVYQFVNSNQDINYLLSTRSQPKN